MTTKRVDPYSAKEVAEILGVSQTQVNRLASSGKLPAAFKITGRTGPRMFDVATVHRIAAERLAAS